MISQFAPWSLFLNIVAADKQEDIPQSALSHIAQISVQLVNQCNLMAAENDKIVICFMMILSAFTPFAINQCVKSFRIMCQKDHKGQMQFHLNF